MTSSADVILAAIGGALLAWRGGWPRRQQFAAAFTEWERRYREEPARFMAEWERLATAPTEYGDRCARYFAKLLGEV